MSDTSGIIDEVMLAEELAAFGVTLIEAKIYLDLVNKQPKSILEISRELNLPRTSVYDNAIKLTEKGLIQKIVNFKSQKLQAYPLSILQAFIDKEKSRVESLQDKLTYLEERIAQVVATPYKTEARYWNALSAKNETVGYSQFGRVEVVGQKFTQKHFDEMVRRGIKDRVITNPKPEMLQFLTVDPMRKSRHIFQSTRILSTDKLYVSGDTTIYNNTFAVAYWKQGEVVGVEIENAELVKTQKSIFEQLWLLAKPYQQ